MFLFVLQFFLYCLGDVKSVIHARDELEINISETRKTNSILRLASSLQLINALQSDKLVMLYREIGNCEFRLMNYSESKLWFLKSHDLVTSRKITFLVNNDDFIEAYIKIEMCNFFLGDVLTCKNNLEKFRDKILKTKRYELLILYYDLLLDCFKLLRDKQSIVSTCERLAALRKAIALEKDTIFLMKTLHYHALINHVISDNIDIKLYAESFQVARRLYDPACTLIAKMTIINCMVLAQKGGKEQRDVCVDYLKSIVRIASTANAAHHELCDTYDMAVNSLVFIYELDKSYVKCNDVTKERTAFYKSKLGVNSIWYKRALENEYLLSLPKIP